MRKADIQSLIWLTRWYNGRSQRLDEIHNHHLGNLEQLVVAELGGQPDSAVEVSFYGFVVDVSFGPTGIEVTSITPPNSLSGDQLILFDELQREGDRECIKEDTLGIAN